MKKRLIICFCLLISMMSAYTNNQNLFLNDSKNLIGILLTILGLSFTSFSFISTSIKSILSGSAKTNSINDLLEKMLKSIEEDIFLIFYSVLCLIIVNILSYTDIPFIYNPTDIDFGLFVLKSFKMFFINFCVSFITCLSIYAFYDLMKASFKLLKKDNSKN